MPSGDAAFVRLRLELGPDAAARDRSVRTTSNARMWNRAESSTYRVFSSGENASPFGRSKSSATTWRRARRVDAEDAVERQLLALGPVSQAVGRIGEEDRAIRSDDHVVGRIQALALVGIGERVRPSLSINAGHAPGGVLAGDQVALAIEGEPVGIAGRVPEGRDLGPFGQRPVADRAAIRNVGEEQIVAAPDGTFGEGETRRHPIEHRDQRRKREDSCPPGGTPTQIPPTQTSCGPWYVPGACPSLVGNLDDHLDLHRDPARQRLHTDG